MKVVGYTRVSSQEQVNNYSLETQKDAIEKFCQDNNYDLVNIYREEGESAKSINRTEFSRMINDCGSKSNDVEMVVIYSFDRFARNVLDHLQIREELKAVGVRVVSILQPLEDDPNGRLFELIHAAFAQHDNEMRALRVVSGMTKALSEGRWMWAAPYGYRRNKPKSSPSLSIFEDEARWVRYAFEQVAKGKKKSQVLDELNRQGARTVKGEFFTKQKLDNIISNSLYAGLINKMEIKAIGDFEPIISEEIYNKANNIKSVQRGAIHTKLHPDFSLRKFVKCSSCGRSITGSWSTGRGGKKYAHYRCENKHCRFVKLTKEKLDALFSEELARLSARPQTLDLLEAVVLDMWEERTSEEKTAKVKLERRIGELKQHRDRLVDAYIQDGKIDSETYEARLEGIKRELKKTEELLPDESISFEKLSEVMVKSKAMLTDLPQTWNRLEIQQKVAFQQVIYPEGLTCDGEKLGITKKSWLFIDFLDENNEKYGVVRPPGLEPGTCRLRVCCSAN